MNREKLAGDILVAFENSGLGYIGSFWFSLHRKKPRAEETVRNINLLVEDTETKAEIEFARNFNPNGCDWGVIITGLNEETRRILENMI